MIYSRGPRCFGSPRATRTLSLPKLTLLVILTWWQVSGSGPAAAPPGGLPARWRADWDLAADVIQSLSHLNGTKRKLDADQSLLSHHLHHIVNDGRPGLRELWRIDSPCCCGCNVVTDRKAFWMLLMLTADCSLNLPVVGGAQWTSSISDVRSFQPAWTPFLESFGSFIHHLVTSAPQVLKTHLLLFRLPQQRSEFGFDVYRQLPPVRAKRLESVLQTQESSRDQRDWRWDWEKTWKKREDGETEEKRRRGWVGWGGTKWDSESH